MRVDAVAVGAERFAVEPDVKQGQRLAVQMQSGVRMRVAPDCGAVPAASGPWWRQARGRNSGRHRRPGIPAAGSRTGARWLVRRASRACCLHGKQVRGWSVRARYQCRIDARQDRLHLGEHGGEDPDHQGQRGAGISHCDERSDGAHRVRNLAPSRALRAASQPRLELPSCGVRAFGRKHAMPIDAAAKRAEFRRLHEIRLFRHSQSGGMSALRNISSISASRPWHRPVPVLPGRSAMPTTPCAATTCWSIWPPSPARSRCR